MRFFCRLLYRSNAGVGLCLILAGSILNAQTPEPSKREPADVLRVFTELVQTDVMVFDKQGRFVNGLTRDNFELKIDGKPKPIAFFETITSGSANEEAQLAAARGQLGTRTATGSAPLPLDRGRPMYFYIDDLHMELPSVLRTQKLIHSFIDNQMGQNDEVAVAAASGQIGFLSQLTDNKFVLRAAIDRLRVKPYSSTGGEIPRMSEYQALLISRRDPDVTNYFIDQLMSQNPGITRDSAAQMVGSRADMILAYASRVTTNTLIGLQGLVRSVQNIPGRKLVFFISDGFFLEQRNSDTRDRLRRITSAAARSGVVIYSIDARGLVANLFDASSDVQFDPTGRLSRAAGGELSASQDALHALAHDTGGKAFFNSNAMEPAVKRAIDDSANYYLLAWSPEQPTTRSDKFRRIEVRVAGRPDLTVQVRRGFFDQEPEPAVAKSKSTPSATTAVSEAQSDIKKLLTALYPERDIPVTVSANFVNTPDKGDLLLTTTSVPTESLKFVPVNGKPTARVAIVGVIYNEKGEVADQFSKLVTMSANSDSTGDGSLLFPYSASLKPGLYQLRVAARDEDSRRGGSARSWIFIPNTSSGQLNLSSVLLGARAPKPMSNVSVDPAGFSGADLRVSNRFFRDDFLRFLVFTYNAATGSNGSKPDVAIQIQIVRDGQPVVTSPLKKVTVEQFDDLKRLPYAAEVALAGLRSGRYVLQISVVDRIAKTSATQQTRFEVQ